MGRPAQCFPLHFARSKAWIQGFSLWNTQLIEQDLTVCVLVQKLKQSASAKQRCAREAVGAAVEALPGRVFDVDFENCSAADITPKLTELSSFSGWTHNITAIRQLSDYYVQNKL
jgi:hypothetical protein